MDCTVCLLQVRRILDVMRGRSFEDAILMMEYMPYRACEEILKALKSVSDSKSDTSVRHSMKNSMEFSRSMQNYDAIMDR